MNELGVRILFFPSRILKKMSLILLRLYIKMAIGDLIGESHIYKKNILRPYRDMAIGDFRPLTEGP